MQSDCLSGHGILLHDGDRGTFQERVHVPHHLEKLVHECEPIQVGIPVCLLEPVHNAISVLRIVVCNCLPIFPVGLAVSVVERLVGVGVVCVAVELTLRLVVLIR